MLLRSVHNLCISLRAERRQIVLYKLAHEFRYLSLGQAVKASTQSQIKAKISRPIGYVSMRVQSMIVNICDKYLSISSTAGKAVLLCKGWVYGGLITDGHFTPILFFIPIVLNFYYRLYSMCTRVLV